MHYFISAHLNQTDDVFEHARVILLYRFSIMFFLIFIIPLSSDIAFGYNKAIVLHGFDAIMLFLFPFLIRAFRNLDKLINFFFVTIFFTSLAATMMLIPDRLNTVGFAWNVLFLALSALLQKGIARKMFCFFFGWIPMIYVGLNELFAGALTWHWIVQEGVQEPPVFLLFMPVILLIYAIWSHTSSIQHAKDKILEQKSMLEAKNKDITDSIHYAKRIQTALLPTENYIDKNINRLTNT